MPSASPMSVSVVPQRSSSRYQSALLRAKLIGDESVGYPVHYAQRAKRKTVRCDQGLSRVISYSGSAGDQGIFHKPQIVHRVGNYQKAFAGDRVTALRGVSRTSKPIFALNHWRVESTRLTTAIGVSQIRAARTAKVSNPAQVLYQGFRSVSALRFERLHRREWEP